jgi:hypothetical protein
MNYFNQKEIIEQIFKDIDNLIEITRSEVPVPINKSKFIKAYSELKKKYLR